MIDLILAGASTLFVVKKNESSTDKLNKNVDKLRRKIPSLEKEEPSTPKRAVHWNKDSKVILIPTNEEYKAVNLTDALYWGLDDCSRCKEESTREVADYINFKKNDNDKKNPFFRATPEMIKDAKTALYQPKFQEN